MLMVKDSLFLKLISSFKIIEHTVDTSFLSCPVTKMTFFPVLHTVPFMKKLPNWRIKFRYFIIELFDIWYTNTLNYDAPPNGYGNDTPRQPFEPLATA